MSSNTPTQSTEANGGSSNTLPYRSWWGRNTLPQLNYLFTAKPLRALPPWRALITQPLTARHHQLFLRAPPDHRFEVQQLSVITQPGPAREDGIHYSFCSTPPQPPPAVNGYRQKYLSVYTTRWRITTSSKRQADHLTAHMGHPSKGM